MFVGPNCGSNDYLEERVELGTEHNRYVISIDRIDVNKSRILAVESSEKKTETSMILDGTLDHATYWSGMLVIWLSTPELEILILDEKSPPNGTIVKALDRRFNSCDIVGDQLVCKTVKRDIAGKASVTTHVFQQIEGKLQERVVSGNLLLK